MTEESCKRTEAGFEANVNRTREGEMGRGEIGRPASRSIGQDRIGFTGGGRAGGRSGCRAAGIQRWVWPSGGLCSNSSVQASANTSVCSEYPGTVCHASDGWAVVVGSASDRANE